MHPKGDQEERQIAEEEEADLIMLTSRGRGGIDRLFMGSVAESVVAESDKAVLMVPVYEALEAVKA